MYICRICGLRLSTHAEHAFEQHVGKCVRKNEDFIDSCRPAQAPFEGDPELAAFARAEGSVYDRQPGTRRRPR